MQKNIQEDECQYCGGTGIIPCDGFDESSGRYMSGVSDSPCSCQEDYDI